MGHLPQTGVFCCLFSCKTAKKMGGGGTLRKRHTVVCLFSCKTTKKSDSLRKRHTHTHTNTVLSSVGGYAVAVGEMKIVISVDANKPLCDLTAPKPEVSGYVSQGNLNLDAGCRYNIFEKPHATQCLSGSGFGAKIWPREVRALTFCQRIWVFH